MKKYQLIILFIITTTSLFSQNFIEVKDVLPQLKYSHVEFIDYDCDNDLDISVWGTYDNNWSTQRDLVVYKNLGNDLFEKKRIDSAITYGSTIGSLSASDINNDNIPEIASIGNQYKLEFTQFTSSGFKRVSYPDINNVSTDTRGLSFSDFDNDGSDEILSGMNFYDNYKKIYSTISFDNIYNEWSKSIDVNNDGKIDILRIHRGQYDSYSSSYLYINNGAGFTKTTFNYSKVPWVIETGDYNKDGFEDLMIFTRNDWGADPIAKLYQNDKNGNFTYLKDIATATSGKFADLDNDGNLDIVLLGYSEVWDKYYLKIFKNNGNGDFVSLPNVSIVSDSHGDIRVGDYDNDGDNDILISSYGTKCIVGLFKNQLVEENPSKANNAPTTPNGLKNEVSFNKVKLSWNQSTDIESSSASLTYNVFIKKDDGQFITSSNASLENGYKRIVGKGNAGFKSFYDINCLEDGKYYWSVQAVDNSNKGSLFAIIDSFEVKGTMPMAPSQLVATTVSSRKIHLTWKDNSGIEDGFSIEMYSDSIPNYRSAGFYLSQKVGANTSMCDIDNLSQNTGYIFRVRAFNCSSFSAPTNTDTATTYPPPWTKQVILDKYFGREAEWGDFDRDGKLDILMFYTKGDAYGPGFTRIIENKLDKLNELDVNLPQVEYFGSSRNGAANWFDFNNDGLLDICLIDASKHDVKLRIYKNNGDKTFTDIKCDSILGMTPGSCGPAFADFDNDGDQDILLTGYNIAIFKREVRIYENLGSGKFVNCGINNITGIIKSRMPWGDFNNDGYIDILANELKPDGTSNIAIYKNNGDRTFTKVLFNNLAGLNGTDDQSGDMRWGDYNNDGYADILISGAHAESTSTGITRVYRNNGDRTFTNVDIGNVYGLASDVSIEWGDYDNDGSLDILQTGDGLINGVGGKTRIYYNNNGIFVKAPDDPFLEIHQVGMSTAADYDNDGDLDILDLGQVSYVHNQIAIFNNFQPRENTRPTVPANLNVEHQNNETILRWDRAQDDTTPSNGLSYNVYLISDSCEIISPAALKSGKRIVVGVGNAQYNNFIKIKNLKSGNYRWSVQSIDNCYEGSDFAPEVSFNYVTNVKKTLQPLVKLYPNPFSNAINIDGLDYNGKCFISISDLMGRTLLSVNNVSLPYTIDTPALKAGIYLITIIQGKSLIVKKIEKK
jgi:hypothetical protein